MKTWLLHNLGLKIFSVILAIVVWWLIHSKIGQSFLGTVPTILIDPSL